MEVRDELASSSTTLESGLGQSSKHKHASPGSRYASVKASDAENPPEAQRRKQGAWLTLRAPARRHRHANKLWWQSAPREPRRSRARTVQSSLAWCPSLRMRLTPNRRRSTSQGPKVQPGVEEPLQHLQAYRFWANFFS